MPTLIQFVGCWLLLGACMLFVACRHRSSDRPARSESLTSRIPTSLLASGLCLAALVAGAFVETRIGVPETSLQVLGFAARILVLIFLWGAVIGRIGRNAAGQRLGVLPGSIHALWMGTVVVVYCGVTGIIRF